MAAGNLNLCIAAGITDAQAQQRANRMLEAVLAQDGSSPADIVGIGANDDNLCVVTRQAITMAYEKGVFNNRLEVRRLGPIASVARLRRGPEGLHGRDGMQVIAQDTSGSDIWQIRWSYWPSAVAEQQSEHVHNVIL
jgi:hypothetical protein